MDRRRFLRVTGVVGVIGGLAGCLGDTTEPTTETTTTTRDRTGTEEPTADETGGLTQPVEVTDSERCAVCNMKPAMYPEWNAQLSMEDVDQQRAHFCSPGCFVAFHAKPDEFIDGASRSAIMGAWATGYATDSLVDASDASWVLERNADRIDAPMMRNPLPFENEDDARAYTDQYDDLTRHSLVTLAAFDVPLARKFRGRFLPETDEPSSLDPAAVPEDEECAVCSMVPAKFPDANAQLSFEDGERAYFCSPGCMASYYAVPSNFVEGRTQDDIVGVWAHDYDSKERINALLATFVLETNASRTDLPMGQNPVPFATRENAIAYVETYDDLTEDDVATLLLFDEELAKTYRGKFF